MAEHEFYSAVGDLVDALSDELAHEVCFAPEVRDRVAHVIGFLGDDYQGYLRSWWLIDAIPRGRRARDAASGVADELTREAEALGLYDEEGDRA